MALLAVGGQPVVVSVYAHAFVTLIGCEVPRALWWRVPAVYIGDDDLTAPIDGRESVHQRTVNPRA